MTDPVANFDPLARCYRLLERLTFGATLQRARTAHLATVAPSAKNVLIIGEGDGRFLKAFRQYNPTAIVTVLDASSAMLSLARDRTRHLGPTTYLRADIRHHPLSPAAYDLIVTHFLLDCFTVENARRIAAVLARAASPGARWLISDFHLPSAGLPRLHARIWLTAMYSFFHLTTRLEAQKLVNIRQLLENTGFRLEAVQTYRMDLIHAEVYREAAASANLLP